MLVLCHLAASVKHGCPCHPPPQSHLLSELLVVGSDRYSKQHKRNSDLKTELKQNFTPSDGLLLRRLTKKHRLHKSCRLLRAKTPSGAKQACSDLYFSYLMPAETHLLLQGSLVKGWSRGEAHWSINSIQFSFEKGILPRAAVPHASSLTTGTKARTLKTHLSPAILSPEQPSKKGTGKQVLPHLNEHVKNQSKKLHSLDHAQSQSP